MHAGSRVSTRALVVALGLGSLPALAVFLAPGSPELPRIELWQPWDLPIAATALALWLVAAAVGAPRLPARWLKPTALALAVAPAVLAAAVLPDTVSNDERAYLLHAEMFARAELTLPLVEPREALRWRQVHEDPQRGIRYPKYAPGTGAALTPAVWLGFPTAAVISAALLDLFLLAAVARRLGAREPWSAPWLLACCPLFALLQTSFQSEVFTLPAALAGYLALLRSRSEPDRRIVWGVAVGACAGWILLTRPLTGVVFAFAMLPGLLLPSAAGRSPGLPALGGAALGGLPFAGLLLLYDAVLTGDPFLTPYAAYAAAVSPWDVYPLLRSDTVHAPVLAVAASLGRQLGRWTPALGGILGAAGIGAFGLWRLRASDGGAGLAFLTLSIAAYALHWYPGHWAYPGPIYAFETLGIAAVGAVLALDAAPAAWRRGLPWAAGAATIAFFATRFPIVLEQARLRAAPQTVAAASGLPADAVVLLPSYFDPERRELAENRYTPSLPPFSEGIVYVRKLARRGPTRAALTQLGLADRPAYRFVPAADGFGGELVPFE